MGIAATILSLGGILKSAKDVSEVLVENKTKTAGYEHEEFTAALDQLGKEFGRTRLGWFDALVDGLNRLPRPALAMGTLGLFGFAMWEPAAFAARMQGLALVPDPLWWLLGAIVSFYFGARELHHFRSVGGQFDPEKVQHVIATIRELEGMGEVPGVAEPAPAAEPSITPEPRRRDRRDENAALEEWQSLQ